MKLSNEQLKKAKSAKSVEELKKLAEENGIELSEELEAKYKSMHTEGEISDDDLDNVSGGCGEGDIPIPPESVPVNKDYICEHYEKRCSSAGGEYMIFIQGKHCESCEYFYTTAYSYHTDPNYDGNGYCYYELEAYNKAMGIK